jgi:hypothetical protein
MKRIAFLASLFTAVLVIVLPFVGGGGPGLTSSAVADSGSATPLLASMAVTATAPVVEAPRVALATTVRVTDEYAAAKAEADTAALTQDWEHIAQKPVPKPVPVPVVAEDGSYSPESQRAQLAEQGLTCPGDAGGGPGGAPGASSAQGVPGTTSDDLASFAYTYNAIRLENCLEPIPYGNFYYDSCMEARLFWMAESPSPDPLDAWGHLGSVRSDGVPSTGCDGNLAGGSGNTGATVASKWWYSLAHRDSLYRPGDGVGGACIAFAMTHGGIDEPYDFTRAAARWTGC